MNNWRHLKAELWSLIGVGRPQDMAELDHDGKPLPLIATGIACAAVFVAVLLGLPASPHPC